MNRKYKTLISNTAIFAISNTISKIILSILLPLYTRTMTVEQYGTTELITTLSQLLYPTLSLAIQEATFRFAMGQDVDKHKVLKNSLYVISMAAFCFVPVSYCFYYYKGIGEYWRYLYFFSVLSMVRSMLSLYVKGINKTLVFSIDTVVFNVILAAGNFVFLLLLHYEIQGYFYASYIALGCSILFLGWNSNIRTALYCQNDWQLLKEMLCYSAPLVLNSISWGLTHVVDRLMLTNMMGADANGIYSAASKIPALLSLFVTVFSQAWTISLIRDYETERDVSFYSGVFQLTHVTCVFVSLTILLFNNNAIAFILGNSFSDSVRYVPVLLMGALFLTYSNYFSSFFSAAKKSNLNMYTSLAGALFNVVFNYLLIPKAGIMGACVATAGSYVFISILRIFAGMRIQRINIDLARFIISVVLVGISAVSVVFRCYDTVIVIASILICLGIYKENVYEYVNKISAILVRH